MNYVHKRTTVRLKIEFDSMAMLPATDAYATGNRLLLARAIRRGGRNNHLHATQTPPWCRLAARPQSGPKWWPASQPATNCKEGPWRSQSSSLQLVVPTNTSGQNMHSRLFWCADHALRWSVAFTGPLRASWPGHTERRSCRIEQIRINMKIRAFVKSGRQTFRMFKSGWHLHKW